MFTYIKSKIQKKNVGGLQVKLLKVTGTSRVSVCMKVIEVSENCEGILSNAISSPQVMDKIREICFKT
jgi:hypothetical protein